MQCTKQFSHNLTTNVAKTRVVDCPQRCPATDYGQIGFYYEFDMSICNDGSFMPARIPCIARCTDIFVYHLCQFTPLAWST